MSEMWGLTEIATAAKVSRQAVTNWRARHKDFPEPQNELSSGPVWDAEKVQYWLAKREGKMPKILSFINLKGGVGKSTVTVAVAEYLAVEHDKRVLLVDLDPQTNSTTMLIEGSRWLRRDLKGLTLRQLFEDHLKSTSVFDIHQAILRKNISNLGGGIENLALLPSSLGLLDIQDQLALIPGGNFYSVSPVTILKKALKPVLADFDYVLIDCPPNLGIITLNGILISDGYFIPVIPDVLSTYGIPQIFERINKFGKAIDHEIPAYGIIVNKFRAQNPLHHATFKRLKRDAAAGTLPHVCESVIPEAAAISSSADFGAPVSTLRQKYGYGPTYDSFHNLTEEVLLLC